MSFYLLRTLQVTRGYTIWRGFGEDSGFRIRDLGFEEPDSRSQEPDPDIFDTRPLMDDGWMDG